ncbi:hyalin-like [Amphiura filiformis]|uniref:hyalin-like n=1 Tax=Amphiura filiformis TaxID=82378 RepID=UPI003B220361
MPAFLLGNYLRLLPFLLAFHNVKAWYSRSTPTPNNHLVLVGDEESGRGRLFIHEQYGSGWLKVCHAGFTYREGAVACRQNYKHGVIEVATVPSVQEHEEGFWNGNFSYAQVTCRTGSEHGISYCKRNDDYHGYCADVYLTCATTSGEDLPWVNGCPHDIVVVTELGTSGANVSWTEPVGSDDAFSHRIRLQPKYRSHAPGTEFPTGITTVCYCFTDKSFNTVACCFTVKVETAFSAGGLRLAGGANLWEGRLEMYRYWEFDDYSNLVWRSRWGTVCDDFFTENEGAVACRQLGYYDVSDVAIVTSSQQGGSKDIWIVDNEKCSGSEFQLQACILQYRYPTDTCGHQEDVYLTCLPTSAFSAGGLRLAGGVNLWEGRLEMNRYWEFDDLYNLVWRSRWGTVCDDFFTEKEGAIACRQLGYYDVSNISTVTSSQQGGSEDIWLVDNEKCSGSESQLQACILQYRFPTDKCGHDQDVYLTCLPNSDTEPPIVNGCPDDIYTVIELGTERATVSWSEPTATDNSRFTQTENYYPENYYPFLVGLTTVVYVFNDIFNNNATCTFTVTVNTVDSAPPNIHDCPSNIIKEIEVGTSSASVFWIPPTATDVSGNATLVSQSHYPGDIFAATGTSTVVYIFSDGSGNENVCSFNIKFREVDTISPPILICPHDIKRDTSIGSLGAIVNWEEPKATGASNNAMLLVRSHAPATFFAVGTTIVTYMLYDSINMERCSFSITVNPGTLNSRLIGGSKWNEGTVEVFHNGVWGTVCHNNWDRNDATVICRGLGLPHGKAQAESIAFYGQGSGPIWLDRVQCSGSENNIDECKHRGWGITGNSWQGGCQHWADAGVACIDGTNQDAQEQL